MKISVIEFFLLQLVAYTILWLISEFAGSLISAIFPPIFLMVFIVALIAEFIEPSRVPRKFFYYLASAIIAPLIVGIAFSIIYGGRFDWLQI